MKLNREQIKKALEWCSSGGNCIKCSENNKNPFLSKEGCMEVQMRNALSLIKELTEEVEQRIEDFSESQKRWEKAYDKLEADHERSIRLTEAYTVRKMRKKLINYYDRNDMYLGYSIAYNVDRVANEMLEEIRDEKSE